LGELILLRQDSTPEQQGRNKGKPFPADAHAPDSASAPARQKQKTASGNDNKKGRNKRTNQQNAAFRRVDPEKWAGQASQLDNSYFGTFSESDYGYKAQERLGSVKGKDFQKEKTKRKRATYRGGSIDPTSVKSIKFN